MTDGGARADSRNYFAIAAIVCAVIGLVAYSIFFGPAAALLGGMGLARATDGGGLRKTSIAAIVIGLGSAALVLVAHFG